MQSPLRNILVLIVLFSWLGLPRFALAIPGVDRDQAQQDALVDEEQNKSFEQLLDEAKKLLAVERPIDARVRLQQALKLQPKDYRPHMLLGQYYLFDVGHFKLAYRYLKTAESLFEKRYGSNDDNSLELPEAQQHALLLYLVSEAELNLDKYQDSLRTLERFEKKYWLPWFPGSRAWVLMKLKRIDEAIRVAQTGLLVGADANRTWNILGILFSVKGNRELSLQAFANAIRAELASGSRQVATPLNNAGEVYRELFKDDYAEASWLKAIQLPDGCEHILPSLNLAILDTDELRLFQAERVMQDFESCFAQNSLREDTEHRTLLALIRGRIALHKNEIDKAVDLLTLASAEQQWFGKIGTNENDVRFAATVSLAQALEAKAAAIGDRVHTSFDKTLLDLAQIPVLKVRAWWLNRRAREIGLEELDDLEDLYIRNTDTMVEYPTLGSALTGFDPDSMKKRVNRLIETDSRVNAHSYYRLYLAENYLAHGKTNEAIALLEQANSGFRPIDRLAKAETLAHLIVAKQKATPFLHRLSESDEQQLNSLREELFTLLPSHLRYFNLALPIAIKITPSDHKEKELLERIANELTSARFMNGGSSSRFEAIISSAGAGEPGKFNVSIHLLDRKNNVQRTVYSKAISAEDTDRAELVNNFISKAFSHLEDPASEPIPELPLLPGIL